MFVSLGAFTVFSQPPNDNKTKSTEWLRVRNDKGDFSIEIPKVNKHYASKAGFIVRSNNGFPYTLADMQMVNAYNEGTLVSIETYSAYETALDVIYEKDTVRKANIQTSKTELPNYSVRNVIVKNDEYYMIRRYFNSKDQIYILTAASRNGETDVIRHFLESVDFVPGKKAANIDKMTRISSLPHEEPGVEIIEEMPKPNGAVPSEFLDGSKVAGLAIVCMGKPSYPTDAGARGVSGDIKIRAKFGEDGWISNLTLSERIQGGILRQTLFAAIRTKFLPPERNGKPESILRTLEYSFSIY